MVAWLACLAHLTPAVFRPYLRLDFAEATGYFSASRAAHHTVFMTGEEFFKVIIFSCAGPHAIRISAATAAAAPLLLLLLLRGRARKMYLPSLPEFEKIREFLFGSSGTRENFQ